MVLSVDDTEIFDDSGLRFKLATFSPGHKAKVEIWRDGKTRFVTVKADTPKESPKRAKLTIKGTNPFEGLSVVNMSPALAEELDLDPFAIGVAVTGRTRRGISSRFRYRAGDIILEVMGTEIKSTQQLQDVLDEYEGERSWEIKLDQGGRVTTNRIRF